MKTLQELAAKYNYYTIDNIPEHIMKDPFFAEKFESDTIRELNKPLPQSLRDCKNIEIGVFVKIGEQFFNNTSDHQLYYIDHSSILVYSPEANNLLQVLTYNKGKQYLHPIFEVIRGFNLSYNQLKDFVNTPQKPNKVGVWTDRKVTEWVKYCNEYCNALQACADSLNSDRAKNELVIKNTIAVLPGAKVSKGHDYTIIDTKMFYIEFQLEDNGAYMQTKIQFKGTLQDIINYKS